MNISFQIGGKRNFLPLGLYTKKENKRDISFYEQKNEGTINEQLHSSFIKKIMNTKTKKNTTRKMKKHD